MHGVYNALLNVHSASLVSDVINTSNLCCHCFYYLTISTLQGFKFNHNEIHTIFFSKLEKRKKNSMHSYSLV